MGTQYPAIRDDVASSRWRQRVHMRQACSSYDSPNNGRGSEHSVMADSHAAIKRNSISSRPRPATTQSPNGRSFCSLYFTVPKGKQAIGYPCMVSILPTSCGDPLHCWSRQIKSGVILLLPDFDTSSRGEAAYLLQRRACIAGYQPTPPRDRIALIPDRPAHGHASGAQPSLQASVPL